jgi:hypothetical protein
MHNGVCRVHGGLSTGPKTDDGKARISAAVTASWSRWRAERGLPADWRYSDSRSKSGRITSAQWLQANKPEGEAP